jgi:hypothetical protein
MKTSKKPEQSTCNRRRFLGAAAMIRAMKTSRLATFAQREHPNPKQTENGKRPLRICVVFDEDASFRCSEILIQLVASDFECATQSLSFAELNTPSPGVAAARKAAETDILMLAARGDQPLPSHIRLWLGLCLGLRDREQEGSLVALITQSAGVVTLHESIVEYLETVAIIGGRAFFRKQTECREAAA